MCQVTQKRRPDRNTCVFLTQRYLRKQMFLLFVQMSDVFRKKDQQMRVLMNPLFCFSLVNIVNQRRTVHVCKSTFQDSSLVELIRPRRRTSHPSKLKGKRRCSASVFFMRVAAVSVLVIYYLFGRRGKNAFKH